LGVTKARAYLGAIGFLQEKSIWQAWGTVAFLAIGAAGWAATANNGVLRFVFASIQFLGLMLFATLLLVNAPRFRRPLIPIAMGVIAVLLALVLIIFSQHRPVLPLWLLVGLMILLILVGWRDIWDATIWEHPRSK
jgi:hypothetical protein